MGSRIRKHIWLVFVVLGLVNQVLAFALWILEADQLGWLPGGSALHFLFTAVGYTWLGLSFRTFARGNPRPHVIMAALAVACLVTALLLQMGMQRLG